jgi:glycolate oxidase FAD binding subunit
VGHHRPGDERALAEIVADAIAQEEPLELVGGGSKRDLGRPMQAPHTLDLGAFAGIGLYEPEELVLSAGAATPLEDIEAALDRAGQMLAFEPPDWRALLGSTDRRQTLGGVLACNLAGPRRIRQGAARDHFLGFHAVSGRGEAFKAGGRVVKNVTGYDLSKLLAGSYGTLAALTEVTVKVLPRPAATRTVALHGLDDAAAIGALTAALTSSHEVDGAAHLPAAVAPEGAALTLVRVEGHLPSVEARAAALHHVLGGFGAIDILGDAPSQTLWRSVRDVSPFVGLTDRVVWRLSLPPSAAAAIAGDFGRQRDVRHFFDWGGGLLWLAVKDATDGGAAAVRSLVGDRGHATLIRAPAALRASVPVFQPLAPALAALAKRVKESFDPKRILNRGRIYCDL